MLPCRPARLRVLLSSIFYKMPCLIIGGEGRAQQEHLTGEGGCLLSHLLSHSRAPSSANVWTRRLPAHARLLERPVTAPRPG